MEELHMSISTHAFFSRIISTTATTAIFTGWLGLALILGLIYWENGEGREGERKDGGDGFIYWICMGWDGRTDDGNEMSSIGREREGKDLIHHLELES
jgi:hypothetical protein